MPRWGPDHHPTLWFSPCLHNERGKRAGERSSVKVEPSLRQHSHAPNPRKDFLPPDPRVADIRLQEEGLNPSPPAFPLWPQVREILGRCTCPDQFPMIKVSEGKYRVGDSSLLIFVRVRVGDYLQAAAYGVGCQTHGTGCHLPLPAPTGAEEPCDGSSGWRLGHTGALPRQA